jgi:DNA-binding beta-propeller fold protein YncE
LPARAATAHASPGQASVVFVQTDNAAGNTIVAYTRTAAGGLQQVGSYPTRGNGGATMGSVVDHLSSEGSLAYDRRAGLLYAVNAGSNTISVFQVRGDRLNRSQVISSGGQFPVSIAVHGNQVFVLNAWGGASVAGFSRSAVT